MSEHRNANDPLRRDSPHDLNARQGGAWTWIAGVVLVVILVALAIGINRTPNNNAGPNLASNNTPTLNRPAPEPNGPASRAFTPSSTNPSGGLTPTAPAKQ
ncbi:MAG TPA: hypothetical protein VMF12_18335 [Xanthobacteraceae bacterium]|nr:hypothetical protein [Xanthobacteraceae bacterium]